MFLQLSFTKTDLSRKFSFPSVNLNMHAGFSPVTPKLELGLL